MLGNSTVVSGAQDNLTVTLDQELNSTTDLLAMLHFPSATSDFGAPIPVLEGEGFGVVTDTATAAVFNGSVGRTLNQTAVEPGGVVKVTVTGQIGTSGNVSFADLWSPSADDSEIISTSFTRGSISGTSSSDVIVTSDSAVSPGRLEIVYEISVPAGADGGTVYEWEPAQGDDGSYLQVGNENFPIFGDQSFEIEPASSVDDTPPDSVSSLLNASG
ncbi:MAG: hypothetical protein J07HX64_03049 [halophilic archaeon J07HX64]|nr:MAG: hypothetical protein J07HX64_03049 [halophilic archaeon J07HX64]